MHKQPQGTRQSNITLVRRLLLEAGARPRRRLGQSFLVDPRGLSVFSSAVREAAARAWLEVGSGPGLLTCSVARVSPVLVSVEIDPAMVSAASRLCMVEPTVLLVRGEGLRWTLAWRGDGLVSNTPYNMTGRLIAAAARNNSVNVAVLGMQKELAHRVMAGPGTRDYGRLTVIAQLFFEVRLVGYLSRDWFYPRPRVDGAVLVLRRKRAWTPVFEGIEEFTACLFSQRNKIAAKVVERCTGGLKAGLARSLRVRDLSPERVLEVFLEWRSRLTGSA